MVVEMMVLYVLLSFESIFTGNFIIHEMQSLTSLGNLECHAIINF